MLKRLSFACTVIVALAAIVVPAALAAGLTNSGFESGFSGWSTSTSGGGSWEINSGEETEFGASLAPWQGAHSALFDQDNPSGGLLYQPFVVPDDGIVTLAYAYENEAGTWVIGGDPWAIDGPENQWLSIDVLDGSASADSFDPADIVETVVRPDTGSGTDGWVPVTLDLSANAGETLILRVATVNTLAPMPVWIDGPGGAQAGGTPGEVRPPERVAYCSVPGNVDPLTGQPFRVGTFLDLQRDQPKSDPHYKDAGVANFVMGLGLTCDQIPIGFTHQGFAGHLQDVPEDTYPLYGPPAPLTTPSSFHLGYGF